MDSSTHENEDVESSDDTVASPGTPTPDAPSPDETAIPSAPTDVIDAAEQRGLRAEVLGPRSLRVEVGSGDVVMAAVPLLAAASGAVAVLAENTEGASAVLMRDDQDMFVIRRDPGVWEHFRSMGGPTAIVGSWRAGERTRFRQRHGALWKAIPAAHDLAGTLGVADLLPAEAPPAPPTPPVTARSTRTTTPRATRATTPRPPKPAAAPPPPPPTCSRCFMQLPTSGVCDCGG